jgi:hypothetical protein
VFISVKRSLSVFRAATNNSTPFNFRITQFISMIAEGPEGRTVKV